MDSLVVMIAGLLLPAWLLGHLFLTFYPAPVGGGETTVGSSDVAVVSKPDKPESEGAENDLAENDLADSSMSDNSTSPDTGTNLSDEYSVQLDSMKEKFQSLTLSSRNLESEVASLKQTNATLAEENTTLKTQMKQASAMSGDVANASDNSAAMNELQSKYASASLKLETTNQNLIDTTTRLESTENEKRTLQNDLANVTSKLEQANADLAAAAAKSEAGMEIRPESGSSASPFAELEAAENSPQPGLAAETNAKVLELEQKLKEMSLNLANTNDAMAAQKENLQLAQNELQSSHRSRVVVQAALRFFEFALNGRIDGGCCAAKLASIASIKN